MLGFSFKINKKYAFDIAAFYKVRDFHDGIDFFNSEINLDLFKGDHNPQFNIFLMLFNFMIFEIDIYNMFHVPEEE
jgi:hypothetical protein